MAKFRFKILVGKHHETVDVTPETPRGRLKTYVAGDPERCWIETDTDLVARFNSSGSIKFERDHSYTPSASAPDSSQKTPQKK